MQLLQLTALRCFLALGFLLQRLRLLGILLGNHSLLDGLLFGKYRHACGAVLTIRAASLDSSDGNTSVAHMTYYVVGGDVSAVATGPSQIATAPGGPG